MDSRDNSNFNEEVTSLYKVFQAREKGIVSPVFELPKLTHPESKRIAARYILFPFSLILILALAAWLFYPSEWLKLVILILTLVGYVGIIAVQLLELYAEKGSILQFLKNPLVIFMKSLVEESADELKLSAELKNFSIESLKLVKRGLDAGYQSINQRVGLLVGAIEKIGIFPGLVTLYLAASTKTSPKIAVFIAVAMLSLYMLAFAVHHALPRLQYYQNLIDFELERRQN